MDQNTGRNEPCPCGSGKKYKRCHGVDAAPRLGTPKAAYDPAALSAAGIDPSQVNPEMLQQFAQAFQRLPKGQMARFQSLMQRAMAGQDVTSEAEELEKTLPPEFQEMMKNMPGMNAPEPNADMNADQARAIIEAAVAEGKLSRAEADALLKGK